MKIKAFLLSLLGAIAFGSSVQAQVTSNQQSTFVDSNPIGHNVVGGETRGQNLFHSFSQIDTTDGRILNFIAPADIENIIGRITDAPTTINGLVTISLSNAQLAPNTSLFLISPKGISFGENAITNIDGTFVASTANALSFADGSVFSADITAPTMLTISAPVGLQMGNNPAPIQVEGINDAPFPFINQNLSGFNTLGRGQNIVLAGGDINIEGNISLFTGRLQLAALSGAGDISLSPIADMLSPVFTATLPTDIARADIYLKDNATILASGPRESIRIDARNLIATGDPTASNDTVRGIISGTFAGVPLPYKVGDVNITTTGRIQLSDNNIYNVIEAGGEGDIGDINIDTSSIYLENSGIIGTFAQGVGTVGNLNISATDSIVINGENDREQKFSGLYSVVGNLTPTSSVGQAGDVTITVGSLKAINGGLLSTSTLGQGDAGNINIVADSVLLEGSSSLSGINSSISSSVEQLAQGDGGNVDITAERLTINRGAAILGRTRGEGDAGSINLTLGSLNLQSGGQLVTTSATDGAAGDIDATVRGSIQLAGEDSTADARRNQSAFNASYLPSSGAFSGIYANTLETSTGRGGNIRLRSDRLLLSDSAQISVSSQGTGSAGSLDAAANYVGLSRSTIQAESRGGSEGNLTIASPILRLRDRSTITTNAVGTATGGNITLNTPFIIGSDNSDILARAEQGAGGRIDINASGLFGITPRSELTDDSDINASSELGIDGTVAIRRPTVDPDNGLVELPADLSDASQDLQAGCSLQQGRFVASGRGGVPINPASSLSANRLWQDLRAISSSASPSSLAMQPASVSEQTAYSSVTEAANWSRNKSNEVVLAAAAVPQVQTLDCLSD